MKRYQIAIFIFLVLGTADLFGQLQRFRMGFCQGLIASQLDGDGFTGYDKLGIRLGIRSQAHISSSFDLVIDLNWEQKGSRIESDDPGESPEKKKIFALDYAEIPVVVRYNSKGIHRLFLEGGASVSYLMRYKFTLTGDEDGTQEYESLTSRFSRSEVNLILGAGYSISRHLGLFFRTGIGITYLYEDPEGIRHLEMRPTGERNQTQLPIFLLRNYLVSINAYYLL